MLVSRHILFVALLGCLAIATERAQADSFESNVRALIDAACIRCHDANTDTGLDLAKLADDLTDLDLTDAETFRRWERVYDRVHDGEMPPESEERPAAELLTAALDSLRTKLHETSAETQNQNGRVPARRLTKLEYGYTLRDLLAIDGEIGANIPDEVDAGSFDTVGSSQRISSVHMQSYLAAADDALDRAIRLGQDPNRVIQFDFLGNPFLNSFHDKALNLGGNVSRKIENGVVLFQDVDYILKSNIFGFAAPVAGTYQITSQVKAFQTDETLTLKILRQQQSGSTSLLVSCDLSSEKPETVEVVAFLQPGDVFYTTFVSEGPSVYTAIASAGGAQKYKGPGLAVLSQQVKGPINETWPPKSTAQLFRGVELQPAQDADDGFKTSLSKPPIEHIADVVEPFAERAFRRPPAEGELDASIELAVAAIEQDRDFVEALRLPLRSILSSPQFLMFAGEPGLLDDYALASRLSYFLWKSLPDKELLRIAEQRKLSQPDVLKQQVERMLDDEKSARFVRDFLGQWLLLSKVNATSPDEKLYPEFDELLGDAIAREPELFFQALIAENLGLTHLMDCDFTFVNRRLANHYGIDGIEGQEFRRIDLPPDSPRGGMLTQAAILKTTANGTVTSPVTRGNFVLTNILGTPPSPPPPTIGSIEPDTRGKTTIREILAAHRDNESCNQCHREIDPPGFALESFDPIGGYRTRYRANATGIVSVFNGGKTYKNGPPVDASGVTADGQAFSGIEEFKQHLLKRKEQVARNFVSQLVVYSTGGEIQFADRKELSTILNKTREHGYRVRDIIHAVVQSRLFRNK